MAAKKRRVQKKITVVLTRAKIVQLCLFFLIAISWTFILGVLAGRGYFNKYFAFLKQSTSSKNGKSSQKEINLSLKPDEFQFYKNLEQVPNKKISMETSEREDSYVFQVAAFKDRKKAESIKASLAGYGFKTKVREKFIRGEKWYKVYVFLSGSIEREMELRKKLKKLGLGKPVVVEKR